MKLKDDEKLVGEDKSQKINEFIRKFLKKKFKIMHKIEIATKNNSNKFVLNYNLF